MNSLPSLLIWFVITPPLLVALFLMLSAWVARRPSELVIQRLTARAFSVSFLASTSLLVLLLQRGATHFAVEVTSWFKVGHYAFDVDFVADRLSLPFAVFVSGLVGITGAFSRKYLHREPGYLRYYALLCLFGGATLVLVMAGSPDFAFFGWELVGFTSTFLIAFFHERAKPVDHALRAFITYRICDIGLLSAAVWLHHTVGATSSAHTHPVLPWWGFEVPPHAVDRLIVGLLLVWASLGKAAQLPFGGWLPRAMEGPTPSSAVFYGAISVHLGPYLLLRAAPLLNETPIMAGVVTLVGGATALHATLVGRVQTDVKSSLAYASMAQVGLIFMEIGMGLRGLAVMHIVGHATLRCLQILRAPSVIHDHLGFEKKLGGSLPRLGEHIERIVPSSVQLWLYRGSLERGFLDTLLRDYIVGTFLSGIAHLDAIGRLWTDFLVGKSASSGASPSPGSPEPERAPR